MSVTYHTRSPCLYLVSVQTLHHNVPWFGWHSFPSIFKQYHVCLLHSFSQGIHIDTIWGNFFLIWVFVHSQHNLNGHSNFPSKHQQVGCHACTFMWGGPDMWLLNNLSTDPNYAVGPSDMILSFPLSVLLNHSTWLLQWGCPGCCSSLLYF